VRSWRLKQALEPGSMDGGAISRSAKATVKALTPRKLRRTALATIHRRVVHAPPPQADESFMAELRERFKPEVVALSDYLDRDLVSLWGYDTVG
jgi:hypothetical protein